MMPACVRCLHRALQLLQYFTDPYRYCATVLCVCVQVSCKGAVASSVKRALRAKDKGNSTGSMLRANVGGKEGKGGMQGACSDLLFDVCPSSPCQEMLDCKSCNRNALSLLKAEIMI